MNEVELSPQAQQLLAQMHDIAPPPPVSWWPPAPGWWLLAFLAMGLMVWAGRRWLSYRQRNRYRQQASSELEQLQGTDTNPLAAQVSELLKRTALTAYPEQHTIIANSFGDEWVKLLNQTCPAAPFSDSAARALSEGPYQPNIQVDDASLKAAAQTWINQHRRQFPLAQGDSASPSHRLRSKNNGGAAHV